VYLAVWHFQSGVIEVGASGLDDLPVLQSIQLIFWLIADAPSGS
jgi:hypothetical protein